MNRDLRLTVCATGVAFMLLGAPAPSWTMPVFVEDDPGTTGKCLGMGSDTVYRNNPGPTGATSTADGPAVGSGGGTYGWISGCAAVGTGLGYTVLGSFANGGNFTGVTAIGSQATTSANFATALGAESLASGVASTALGIGSVATGGGAVSIGGGGASVLGIADSTTASGDGSIAMGVNSTKGAQAAAADSIALGAESSVVATATAGVAIGNGASVLGASGVAMGAGAVSGATGTNVAIGTVGTTANAIDASGGAVAIGRGQRATGNGAVAIGDPNVANGTGAVALGANNTAAGDAGGTVAADGAIAIGNANAALGTGSIAIGSNSTAGGAGAIALGVGANADAADAMALGTGTSAGEPRAVALGAGSQTAAAVGTAGAVIDEVAYVYAGTTPTSTVSVGTPGTERTISNVAAGRVSADSTDAVNGSQLNAAVIAINLIANLALTVPNSWIIGSPGTYVAPASSGTDSTAVGSGASVTANNSVAVGTGASATIDNSVALGNGSTTTAAAPTSGTVIRGNSYDFAGADPAGVVSLGSAGAERQLQHMAAGQVGAGSTDAINGSQLFAASQALNNLNDLASAGYNVTTAATGTGVAHGTTLANVGPEGTVTYTAGNNMALTQSGTNVAFAVNPNPVFASLSIEGGPRMSSAGIDAGGTPMTNVAPGVAGTDAVNMNQFNAAVDAAGAGLQPEIDKVARKAHAGVASALSLEEAPFVPGKTTFAAAVGYFRSQGAVGFALRRTSDSGRWSITGGLAGSSGGVAARAGFGGIIE